MTDWPEGFTIRPVDSWPDTPTPRHARRHSPFKSSLRSTLYTLGVELRALSATRKVLMLEDLEDRDLRVDGYPRAQARIGDGVIVAFESKHGPLRYACDRYWGWQENLRAIALGLEALRKVERYGIATRGEQYRGWNALPAGTAMAEFTFESAAAFLMEHSERSEGSTLEEHYRDAVKRHHPDVGGDPETFRRLTAARDLLARS